MKNFISGFCILSSVLSFNGCTGSESSERSPIERLNETTLSLSSDVTQNLKFLKTALAEFPDQLPLTGKISVTEDRTSVVPSRVGGRIEGINFASGEYVKKGQILATLFSPDYVTAKEEYLQSLKQVKPGSSNDNSADFLNLVEMSKKKLGTMGLTPADIDTISSSNPNQTNLPVHASRDGFLIAKTATLGNLVNVGDPLFTIADLTKVWFSGDLYPEDLPKIQKNQEVIIRPIHDGQPIFGRVSFISPVVDPTTRTIKIRALMDNPTHILRADMYVQGNLILKRKQALLLPNEAIVRAANNHIVFKRVGPHSIEHGLTSVQVQKVTVQLGAEQQGFTEVTGGILEGDEIVTDGALLLYAALNSSAK